MKASIDAIADLLPAHIVDAMKVDPECVVPDIVANAMTALHMGTRYKDVLARAACPSVRRIVSATLAQS